MPEAHHHRACPVWVGYLLASPVRRLFQDPRRILAPHVGPGTRVMDVGCAMGFFSLPLAGLTGPGGHVIAVDVQEGMLEALRRRARRARLLDRIETRVCRGDTLGVADLDGTIDFVLAFAVVHEVGDAARFFSEVAAALKPTGRVLFAEPTGHVAEMAFQDSLTAAARCGLQTVEPLKIARTRAVLLGREGPARPVPAAPGGERTADTAGIERRRRDLES